VLIIDDYHTIDAKPVDAAVTFLLAHMPAHMHLVVATREDPQLPLGRLRGGGQLCELRVADLRFTPSKAAGFLNGAMGLNLAAEDIATLEARTEGWIAGLQLAALSLQEHPDAPSFIRSFTGSHRFVLDARVERASLAPFTAPDRRGVFTPDRVAIETERGELLHERFDPRLGFKGHTSESRGAPCRWPTSSA